MNSAPPGEWPANGSHRWKTRSASVSTRIGRRPERGHLTVWTEAFSWRKNDHDFADIWRVHRNHGVDCTRRRRGCRRAPETIQGGSKRLDGDRDGLGFRCGWWSLCRHRLWQQGRFHQSRLYPRYRNLLRRLLEVSSFRRGSTGGSICGRSSSLGALFAPLEGNSGRLFQVGCVLHRAGNSEFWRQLNQRNYRGILFGLCHRRDLLEDRIKGWPRCGSGPLPCRGRGLGHWTLAGRYYWICDQSSARPWSANCSCGSSDCRKGRLRLGICGYSCGWSFYRREPRRPGSAHVAFLRDNDPIAARDKPTCLWTSALTGYLKQGSNCLVAQ